MASLNRIAPVLVLFLVIAVGCDTMMQEEARPPEIIPARAFTVQTELFSQNRSGTTAVGTHAMITKMRIWPVTTALASHLTLPVATTKAALGESPVVEGGAWVWKATTPVDGEDVAVALSGAPRGDRVEWTMRITNAAVDDDSTFVLYTANTTFDGTSGSWQLFAPAEDTTQNVLDATFEIEKKEEKKEITFQIPETAREHAGHTIVYVQHGDRRSLQWMQVEEAREHTVVWNAKTHAGSITATNYNDGQKACWGEELRNVECTQ